MIITIFILIVIIFISVYTNYNLLVKNEKYEDMVKKYEKHINDVSNVIEFSNAKLKEIDARETFKSDDEIGWFFDQIKYLQEQLNDFQIKK
jgi:hypothetical protein